MKNFIEKTKARGEEHVKKMVKLFAFGSTLLIVIVWLLLLSFTRSPEPEVQVADPNAPDIGAFLDEVGSQIGDIVESVEETGASFQENLELAREQELQQLQDQELEQEDEDLIEEQSEV